MKSMDFKSICRICLETNKQTFDIFTSYYVKRNILYCEMLSECTKVKPLEEDGLPRLICKDCCRQLKRTYAFNIQCEESEKTLKSYSENLLLPKPDTEIDVEYISNEIKCENSNIKDENNDVAIQENKNNCEVKLEPFNENDETESWSADDDNVALGDIKLKKTLNGKHFNLKDKIKGIKNGKKGKSIYSENNLDKNSWNVYSNAKLLFDEDKSTKVVKDLIYEEDKVKKKRGRKKREYLLGEVPPLPDSKTPHQCDVCGKILSTKSNLKAHKICHTELRPYKCKECPAAFRGHSALFQHRKIHTGETPYHCEYCSKPFSRRTGLVNHIRVHTGEKLYSCTICFKNFVQSAQLSIHMKRHKGDKTFLCQECGKGFPIKADLNVHQRTHNGEKPYSCHLCEKTFATSGNLSIHIRIHNKEVRYKCKECHRGFVTCSSYNVHLKRHKGQRDYHCECGKTFYTSSALKQHKVVHTGVKKYQCKICERKFSQTSHLTRHFRRDHMKPNVPLPPSNQYRLVLPEVERNHLFEQKVPESVKCEET